MKMLPAPAARQAGLKGGGGNCCRALAFASDAPRTWVYSACRMVANDGITSGPTLHPPMYPEWPGGIGAVRPAGLRHHGGHDLMDRHALPS